MSLAEKVDKLPQTSGVYLFTDRRGRVIYVGKAINLRSRVKQYLAGADERAMVPFLVRQAADVEVVVTHTNKEALLLENSLIKRHRPRFNTQLRDDKAFLHLRIDPREPWPRFLLVRRIKNDGARYFGPYAAASQARETVEQLQRAFPLRTCTDHVLKSRSRPCILHQMGRCVAPCVELAERADYAAIVEEAILFLEGRSQKLVERLGARMEEAAEALEFERAARLRDTIRSVEGTLEKQRVVDAKQADRDVFGLYREGDRGAVAVVPVRDGVMGQPRASMFQGFVGDDAELLSSIVNAAYPEGASLPPEVLLPVLPHDADALAEVLSERRERKVVLHAPLRGEKLELVRLASENARVSWHQAHDEDARRRQGLEDLARVVGLPEPPHRIECFDNSNIGGQHPVAAMSVFLDGRPAREEYRRYRVKTVVGSDDFATMREILGRRIRRGLEEGGLPDLLVIDGGKGQVAAVRAVLADLGVSVPMIGVKKPRTEHRKGDRDATDKLVLPDAKDPIALREGHPALRVVQWIRDEAHKHAIGYHRQVRGRDALVSVLEGIPGIGPGRRKALLTHLGSAAGVAEAEVTSLAAVPGIGRAVAEKIWAAFHGEVAEE